ncbi:MAG: RDD family protein [Candidatus Aenigmatarchaeota archaeon]
MPNRPEPDMGTEKDALPRRIVAVIIDSIIMGLIAGLIAGGGALGAMTASNIFSIALIGIAGIFIMFFYAFLLEGYIGQTIGKMVMGIVVVKENGEPCDYLASFVRNLLRIVDGLFYYLVGLVAIILSNKRQRIGDHIANTVVVKARK